MSKIVNVRGTSGSGKTTIVRAVMGYFKAIIPDMVEGEVWGYRWVEPTTGYVVGKYESECGGCDTIKTQDEVCDRVRYGVAWGGHVIFEGLLLSHIYKRYAELSDELGGIEFVFLDVPVEECVERVRKRRIRRGDKRPFNPANTIDKHANNFRTMKRLEEHGCSVHFLNNEDAVNQILDWFLV